MKNIKNVLRIVICLVSIAPLCASQEPAKKRKDRDEHAAAAAASSSSSASVASASLAGQSAPEAQDSQGQASSSDESATKKHKNESGQSVAILTKDEFIAAIKAEDKEKVDAYLNKNQDVDWVDQQGKTPLIHACDGNCLPIFQSILAHTQNVEMESINGATALLFAAENAGNNSVEYMRELLARGARLDVKNKDGWNALMYAAKGNKSGVAFLLAEKKVPVDEQDEHGRTALFLAIESIAAATTEQQKEAAKQIAEFLLKHGANIEHRDKQGYTILHRQVWQWFNINTVRFLLDYGADINALLNANDPNSHKYTSLEMAIIERGKAVVGNDTPEQAQELAAQKRKKLMEIIYVLVERGASLDLHAYLPGKYISPLMVAASSGDFEIVKFLVMPPVSAPIGIRNSQGETADDYAYRSFVIEKDMEKKEQYRLIMQFLSNPLNVARLDEAEKAFNELNIPRRIAFQKERKENKKARYEDYMHKNLFNIMEQYMIEPETKYRVVNILSKAIQLNNVLELEQLFIQHPAAVIQENEAGDTPLIVAIKWHKKDAFLAVIHALNNYRFMKLWQQDVQIKEALAQDADLKEFDSRYQTQLDEQKSPEAKEQYKKGNGLALMQRKDEVFKRKFHLAKDRYKQDFDQEFRLQNRLEQAKKIAEKLGYQDMIKNVQEYIPHQWPISMEFDDQFSSASAAPAAASSSSTQRSAASDGASSSSSSTMGSANVHETTDMDLSK